MTRLEKQMKYVPFTKELIKRDIRRRWRGSLLGAVWTVFAPLLCMLVTWLLFSALFKKSIANYPVFLLCGQLIFGFMSGASYRGMTAVVENADYIRSAYVPKYVFVLARTAEGFLDMLISMAALFLVMLVTRAPFTLNLLMLPMLLILTFMFTLGLALILAAYGTIFRGLRRLYGGFTVLWLLCSTVFYPKSAVPSSYRFMLDLNPAIHFIEIMRAVCCEGALPAERSLLIATCYSALMLIMGVSVFRANDDKLFRYV